MEISLRVEEFDDRPATSIELIEIISSPSLLFGVMISQAADGTLGVVTFDNSALVAVANVIVEGIFEGQGEELVGAFDLEDDSSDDGVVLGPAHGDDSGGVEESGPDDLLAEVLLQAALLDVPANDLDVLVPHVVLDLDNVKPVVVVVVALEGVPLVVVEPHIVVVPEDVPWVEL